MSDHLMLDAATAWLRQECTAAVVRAIDAGASPDALAASFAQLGFDDALRAEFTDHVPVTFVDGEQFSLWFVDRERLAAALA